MGAMANRSATVSYLGFKEAVVVCNDKGLREVRYYLKYAGGGADLVVVGKERTRKRMSYHYANKDLFLNRISMPKLRYRREVVDWLNAVISDQVPGPTARQFGGKSESKLGAGVIKKYGPGRAEFLWLGLPWTCRKRRRHYESFSHNGFTLSVNSFVYVLAEENKRLVAYLYDIYEDSRGNKMAVVRWFHKIDEVGFVLPRIYNDEEIFFSLCLQDLSIECIDGLTTVLSPEHYEKYISKATRAGLEVFMCCRQFDNDVVKPFDITTVKGYKQQRLLKGTSPTPELFDANVKQPLGDAVVCRPTKRIRLSKVSEKYLKLSGKDVSAGPFPGKKDVSPVSLSGKGEPLQTCSQHFPVGSQVEVLSQDSGVRGCWFRALIIKKYNDKVKIQYEDIKDAADDVNHLQEWILASRIAAPDVLGIRISGRTIVRPNPSSESRLSSVDVGSIVDAWWHDGWWEGIVMNKESGDKLLVHFPGEKQEQILGVENLRRSQEWYENGWRSFNARSDLPSKISCCGETVISSKSSDHRNINALSGGTDHVASKEHDLTRNVLTVYSKKNENTMQAVRDLSKDGLLAQLRWKASGKRRPRPRCPVQNSSSDISGMQTCERFFVGSTLKLRPDNWKYDNGFSSSMVSPLVMSS